jgi:hypothetical protein
LPVGTHLLRCIYTPVPDTILNYVTILPRHKSTREYKFAFDYFTAAPPPATGDTLLWADFDADEEGFVYSDDSFRGTAEPAYASGSYDPAGGNFNGGLVVTVGGIDNSDIFGMSGGWQVSFDVTSTDPVHLSLYYKLDEAGKYNNDEFIQMLVSIDGILYGRPPNDYVDQLTGDGNAGSAVSTGWRTFDLDLGPMAIGMHSLVVGCYNNKKTHQNESGTAVIDDILIVTQP